MTRAVVAAEEWVRWSWVADHTDDITAALREHVSLTALAVGLGLLIALPLGIAASRWRPLLGPTLTLTGIFYSIPSLALFAMLGPIFGYLSLTTALVPLAGYTLLILVRNVVTGLDGVPEDIKESATGMGYGRARRLLSVELPLALPAIIAGVRIATVSTIGLVTIAGLLGRGGLGDLIFSGLRRDFRTEIVVGSALAIALAFVVDLALVFLQRVATPWDRGR